ncbi:esterase-like activity of phytase-domain-containing protein [Tricladium varicosporioides]|nr:esterase-like activity of phytase-domain-containing protein [Hymenoscyphus varicosporioides]
MHFFQLGFVSSIVAIATAQTTPVAKTLCAGKNYTYDSLAGFGLIPSNARDKFGDTLGGFGSAIALDRSRWRKLPDGSYTGVLYGLPDRGWNTQGTTNFQPRIHKFDIAFKPNPAATVASPSGNNLVFTYRDTIRLFAPDGTTPTSGLDADGTGHITIPGFPPLPGATIVGDGWGNPGPISQRIVIDAEGLALAPDGGFWISDEYGPYMYRFDSAGKMVGAIRPPDAIIPMRNGSESFSADSPPHFPNLGVGHDVFPSDNPTGRNNNKGLEGLALSGDGKTLWVLLQAAANQDGGLVTAGRRHTRLLKYDVTIPSSPRYAREFVVPLPFQTAAQAKVAAQSEIFHIQDGSFFILARDSGAGHGQSSSTSVYRHIDVFNIDKATDIKGKTYDCSNCSIASPTGVLNSAITPAEYCPFIDFNLNPQLNRFGVHNGGAQDAALLNEKWESIGIVPVDGLIGDDDKWFVFSLSDNDFVTQNGFMNGGGLPYSDASGFNLDTQALVFQISLPEHSRPFPRDP